MISTKRSSTDQLQTLSFSQSLAYALHPATCSAALTVERKVDKPAEKNAPTMELWVEPTARTCLHSDRNIRHLELSMTGLHRGLNTYSRSENRAVERRI